MRTLMVAPAGAVVRVGTRVVERQDVVVGLAFSGGLPSAPLTHADTVAVAAALDYEVTGRSRCRRGKGHAERCHHNGRSCDYAARRERARRQEGG